MHSLVLSQCSEIPHKLSSDIQELLRSSATICTGASSCQYRTSEWSIFVIPGFSQYTLKRSSIFKAALHVLPRQNRPSTNLKRDPFEKKKTKPKQVPLLNPVGRRSKQNRMPPTSLHQFHRGKIFQEASVHLRKCL